MSADYTFTLQGTTIGTAMVTVSPTIPLGENQLSGTYTSQIDSLAIVYKQYPDILPATSAYIKIYFIGADGYNKFDYLVPKNATYSIVFGSNTLSLTQNGTNVGIYTGTTGISDQNAWQPLGEYNNQQISHITFSIDDNWDIQILDSPTICLHGSTQITTPTGTTPIACIKSGTQICDAHGNPMTVLCVIVSDPVDTFVQIQANALGTNVPSTDIMITHGHSVVIDGKEVDCADLVNGTTIRTVRLDYMVSVYSLCTHDRTTCLVSGVEVVCWKLSDWRRYALSRDINWIAQ